MPEPNAATTRALEDAANALLAAYDPSNPANLVGMTIPHGGKLRAIVDAAVVDGQLTVLLAAVPERVTVTVTSVPR